eukprot:m.173932 g.173932  ORF g.173932 m.173932 type:complete len:301 (+) comp31746_c0_seq2:1331-2233(+)
MDSSSGHEAKPPITFRQDFIAGSVGGCTGLFVAHPLDVVKVRMQLSGSTLLATAKSTISKEGFSGMYKGVWPPLATAGALNAIVFSVYGGLCRWFGNGQPCGEPTKAQVATAASLSGFATCFLVTPMEMIKCRQQVDANNRPSALTVAKRIIKSNGFRGLYRGWWPTVAREVPSYAVYFLAYEFVKTSLSADTPVTESISDNSHGLRETFVILIAGSAAGASAWTSVYPIDTVKTIMQTQQTTSADRVGFIRLGSDLIHRHGVKFLFRGFDAMLIRTIPMNAITFLLYEKTLLVCQTNAW